jgi:hypothetical protein
MKPKSRLLISFTLPNGDIKGWGYDQKFHATPAILEKSIADNFSEIPENTEIRLSYYGHETTVEADNGAELISTCMKWIASTGDYN